MRRGLLIASVGALIVGGCLALAGVVGVAWMLLSANSPLTLAAPHLLVPLITTAYSLRPATVSSARA